MYVRARANAKADGRKVSEIVRQALERGIVRTQSSAWSGAHGASGWNLGGQGTVRWNNGTLRHRTARSKFVGVPRAGAELEDERSEDACRSWDLRTGRACESGP